MTLQEIGAAAKELHEDEREILIHELMAGLGSDEQHHIDQLQLQEVKTRLKDMREKPSALLDGDQVLSALDKEFG